MNAPRIITIKCAIYTRVSTEEQAKEGYSLEAQEDRLRVLARSFDWAVYKIYSDEGFSAKNRNRPALKQMMIDAKIQKFNTVLVYKIDRLSRSLKDLIEIVLELSKSEVGFKSSTEMIDTTTAEGRLMFHQFGSFAQYERELIGQRTRMALIKRLKQGNWNTIPPYGYKIVEGKLEIDKPETQNVHLIFDLYLKKNMGIQNITHYMNKAGCKPRLADHWRAARIYKILTNPVYTGLVRWGGEEAEGVHSIIISKEVFQMVKKLLPTRKHKTQRYRSPNYLSGFVKCGLCGSTMTVTYPGKKENFKYYVCQKRYRTKACKQEYIRADILENSVLNEIVKFSKKKTIINEMVNDYLSHSREQIAVFEKSHNEMKTKMKAIQKEKGKLAEAIIHQNPSGNTMKILNQQSDKIVEKEELVQKELWKMEDKIQMLQSRNYGVKGISDFLKNFSVTFEGMEFGERKLLIESLIEEVVIGENKTVSFTLIPPLTPVGKQKEGFLPKNPSLGYSSPDASQSESTPNIYFRIIFRYGLKEYYEKRPGKTVIQAIHNTKKYSY